MNRSLGTWRGDQEGEDLSWVCLDALRREGGESRQEKDTEETSPDKNAKSTVSHEVELLQDLIGKAGTASNPEGEDSNNQQPKDSSKMQPKRIERMMKNRAAAKRSYFNKKLYVERLEEEIRRLSNENVKLESQLEAMQSTLERIGRICSTLTGTASAARNGVDGECAKLNNRATHFGYTSS
mmetsp:Transcript_28258/g.68693  ORF Transcript_28258/g.68693 Transcript_28258/m.68693 type:complete len:182 (+) Transcript_28258:542-1087(+)|eukprot:CAMPEP_0198327204 /NCGR_PEP_ID=MMETSP1450-20131203/14524_1 /TAXON_ID=753684 ORGANISM="Madagascaria erythrocladiodes, Strain CCMP3234" /NCGR_SAMPLE_ID=MMETSP1450 /ASSEMBLY_ACC=CAM_ASM_001115 /LENGTH=181 /DNA_ID=CAMNT_0044031235 /DNA_START=649 /DNA_END=1194 /DNA_ORIENTATION=-